MSTLTIPGAVLRSGGHDHGATGSLASTLLRDVWNGYQDDPDGDAGPGRFSATDAGYPLQVVSASNQVRASVGALRVEVRHNCDPFRTATNTGYGPRAELQRPSYEAEGMNLWYSWSTRFGDADGSGFPVFGGWQTFTQWHSERNGSPPIAFYCDGGNEIFLLLNLASGTTGSGDRNIVQYGFMLWRAPLVRGKWYDFVMNINWSSNDSQGYQDLWVDGVQQRMNGTNGNGQFRQYKRNLDPGLRNYMKQGYYRAPSSTPITHIVYHDNWKMTDGNGTERPDTTPPGTTPPPDPPPGTDPNPGGAVLFENVLTGLDTIWSMQFAPNGDLFFTERAGRLNVLSNGVKSVVLTLGGTESLSAEEGLQGMALSPNFATDNHIFVYYSFDSGGIKNRVVRYTYNPATKTAGSPLTLLDNIPGFQYHVGGRIKFGPDGKLYICVGDAADNNSTDADVAQDITSLNGKILRINPDGTPVADNPFIANADTNAKKVYSYGHRNPQGLAWHPTTGDLWATEHGPTSGAGPDARDELNRIVKGGNYGWPKYYGGAPTGKLTNPNFPAMTVTGDISAVMDSGLRVWAPGSLMFYSGDKLGDYWKNCALWPGLGIEGRVSDGVVDGRAIYRLPLSGSGSTTPGTLERLFGSQFGRLREMIQGPDGYIYIATSNRDGRGPASPPVADDRIIRVVPANPTTPPTDTLPPAPAPPPGTYRLGYDTTLTDVFETAQPDTKRGVLITIDQKARIRGAGVGMKGVGSGSGSQVHVVEFYDETTDSWEDASPIGQTLQAATLFNSPPYWQIYDRPYDVGSDLVVEAGTVIRLTHHSDQNAVSQWGVNPTGALVYSRDVYADGPADPFDAQSVNTGGFDIKGTDTRGMAAYLILEPFTEPTPSVPATFADGNLIYSDSFDYEPEGDNLPDVSSGTWINPYYAGQDHVALGFADEGHLHEVHKRFGSALPWGDAYTLKSDMGDGDYVAHVTRIPPDGEQLIFHAKGQPESAGGDDSYAITVEGETAATDVTLKLSFVVNSTFTVMETALITDTGGFIWIGIRVNAGVVGLYYSKAVNPSTADWFLAGTTHTDGSPLGPGSIALEFGDTDGYVSEVRYHSLYDDTIPVPPPDPDPPPPDYVPPSLLAIDPLPQVSLPDPFVPPYVAKEELTFPIDIVSVVAPDVLRWRVYVFGDSPPAWVTVPLTGAETSVRAYVTVSGLVRSTAYTAEFEVESENGIGTADMDFVWDPEALFTTQADPRFGIPERPFSFPDYAAEWANDLPPYYDSDPFMQTIQRRLGTEMQRLHAAMEETRNATFSGLATERALARIEASLNITPPADLSLDRRRAIVLTHYRMRFDASAATFAQVLEWMLGYKPAIRENFADFSISVEIADESAKALVLSVASRIVPAHIVISFDAGNLVWSGSRRRAPIMPVWPRTLSGSDVLGVDDPGTWDEGRWS